MLVVLVLAAGATWESAALAILGEDPGTVVLKRCVDIDDLLACTTSGQARAAVVGIDAPGLDAAAVDHLRAEGVRPVAIVDPDPGADAARLRATRIGITAIVAATDLRDLPAVLTAPETRTPGTASGVDAGATPDPLAEPVARGDRGRRTVVWGPAGAPGRSTLAAAVASELARRGTSTILIDADPYGGTLAQRLGVLDEVSGLLAAARLSAGGDLASQFSTTARRLEDRLVLVSGLPRSDRWVELRAGAVEHLIDVAADHGHVVIDTGFSLEQEPGVDFASRPGRNQTSLDALGVADEIVVVGAADPVSLSRVVRGLAELRDLAPDVPVWLAINRMRPTVGWAEKDISSMVSGFAPLSGLFFIPDDTEAVDRALATGRSLLECGDSPIVRAVSALVDGLGENRATKPAPGRSLRRRRVGTTRRR